MTFVKGKNKKYDYQIGKDGRSPIDCTIGIRKEFVIVDV
jgi:hypothetical protein